MPTGNEFTAVTYGQSDQSYKQTDREMSGGIEPQIGPPLPEVPSGSYPRTFDREAGSEPLATSTEDNPIYYPEKVYEYIKCSGPSQSYVTTERESVSGEYGQCGEQWNLGKYTNGDDVVPQSVPSKQFSSRELTTPPSVKMNAYGNNILGPVEGK